jgi:hypothetical protein
MGMKQLGVGILLLLLSGCASSPRVAGVYVPGPGTVPFFPEPGQANIALGRDCGDVWMAQEWAYRPVWPATDAGIRLDDVTSYSDVQVDDQYFYDRFGGFYKTSETVRTGVLIR